MSKGKLDPKVYNFLEFFVIKGGAAALTFYVVLKLGYKFGYDAVHVIFAITIAIILWRALLSIYRRVIKPAKKPLEYGKWAIVTGTTSGIGREFADYLAKVGCNVLIISRTESKLIEQKQELEQKYPKVKIAYLAYDFSDSGPNKKKFYADLDAQCKKMHADGGIGLLMNNVGTANDIPKTLDEFTDDDIEGMINCNIYSTINMTRAVKPYMVERKNGAVVSISSGSGNLPAPYLVVYSATKAFITQFSRSMHVEMWDTGVDFYVVTPFYVVSNLYKRKTGTFIAPMPIKLVEGTLAQLGKKMVWQGHGYWMHGFLGWFSTYYWDATARWKRVMEDNRRRWEERQAKAAVAKKDK